MTTRVLCARSVASRSFFRLFSGRRRVGRSRSRAARAAQAAAPIVVRAKDGEVPHFNRPAADQNVIDLDSVEYLVLRGLEVSGGSHGIRMVSARFVTIENCDIHDTG